MTAESESRSAAERFRRDHHLGDRPLGDLVAIIEQTTGVDVAVLGVGPDEHGLTMRDPERHAVFIAVARTRRPMRQRSTLAHELGHVIFEDWRDAPEGSWSEPSPRESRANAFARHLLVPITGLRDLLEGRNVAERADLSAIVQQFLVSPKIATIALHDAGYIDDATKHEWLMLTTPAVASRFGWIDQYHALQDESDHRRAPQRLLARAVQGYLEHVVPVTSLARLRGVSSHDVETELRGAGLFPIEEQIAWSTPADLPDVQVDLTELDRDGIEGSGR